MVEAGRQATDREQSLQDQLRHTEQESASLSPTRRLQEAISLATGHRTDRNVGEPTLNCSATAAAGERSVLKSEMGITESSGIAGIMEMGESFSQIEQRLDETAADIGSAYRTDQVSSIVDDVMGADTESPSPSRADCTARGLTLEELSARDGTSGGLVPWLQGLDAEYFKQFDTNNSGTLDRNELHKAAAAYLAQERGEDVDQWHEALRQGLDPQ